MFEAVQETSMSGFDRYRFVEAFAAALLGAYVHDQFQNGNVGPQGARDAVQKFQRSLLLAASNDGFTETVSLKYKQRISLLSESARLKYIRLTLQPNQSQCDERLTALLIFDHALQSNVEWEATIRMLSLDQLSVSEKAENSATDLLGGLEKLGGDADQAFARHAERLRSDRLAYLSYRGAYRQNRAEGMGIISAVLSTPRVAKDSRHGRWKSWSYRLSHTIMSKLTPF